MGRIVRWALVAALGAGALGAAGAAWLRTVDFDRFRPALVAELRQATGRDAVAEGPLRLTLWPRPRFTLSAVAVANAPWGTRPAFADVQRVEGDLSLRALLRGEIRIERLRLVQPDLWLETDPYGKVNWVLADGQGPAQRLSLVDILAVERFEVLGGRLAYRNGATGDVTVVDIESAWADGGAHGVPFRLSFAGSWNDLPIRLRGAVGAYDAIASDEGNATELRIVLEAAGAGLFIEGTAGDPAAGPGLDLHIAGKAAALDGLSAMLGLPLPRSTAVSIASDLRYRGSTLELTSLALTLGEVSVAGTIRVDLSGARPRVAADLAADSIDLSALFSGASSEDGPAGPGGPGLVEMLTASGLLAAADGEATLRVGTLRIGPLALREAAARLVLADGGIVAAPVRAESEYGPLEGSIRFAGEASPPRLFVSVKAPALAVGPALQRLGTVKAFGGVMSVAASLGAVAGPAEAMLRSLEGEALIAMGEGRLTLEPHAVPFDLAAAGFGGLVGLLAAEGRQDVAVECLAGRLAIEGGVAETDGLVVQTADARLKGEGSVDLAAGRLALRFVPEARGAPLIVGEPVAVGGSFAAPRLSAERGAAEAQAFSDTALYPIRRFFATLGTDPAANACLRSLPAPPRKRPVPGREPVAEAPVRGVQEAAVPRPGSERDTAAGKRAE